MVARRACAALMRVSLVCTLLSAGWSAEDTSYFRTLKLTALKKFVYVRGEDCSSCSTKDDWAAKAAQVAPKPMDLELEKEWKTQQAYKKQLKDFKITRKEFLQQMNASGTIAEGKQADRLWETFQEQLEGGEVQFVDNGSLRFALPITHHIAPYTHPHLVEATGDVDWSLHIRFAASILLGLKQSTERFGPEASNQPDLADFPAT